MSSELDPKMANELETAEPVPDLGIKFTWHNNYWREIFDEQIALICADIKRARAEDRLIIYLSCPISARGGGDHRTNVDIAKATERRLLTEWGEGFWILNPAQYQMESKEGLGLIESHARKLGINLGELRRITKPPAPSGGDYMRMWTKVLVDDTKGYDIDFPKELSYTGQHFDGYYFLGPNDVMQFFTKSGGETLTAAVQTHFSRKFTTDPDFRDYYSIDKIAWGADRATDPRFTKDAGKEQNVLRDQWEEHRRRYLKFYALKAGVNFSLGSHDEWEILRLINYKRCAALKKTEGNLGIPDQMPAFFDGRQVDIASYEGRITAGYAA
jgi:hypothetical protein